MSLGFIVTLEKEIPDAAQALKAATGKALARESDRLEFAARRKSVTPLTGLLSENQQTLIDQMRADGFDPSKMRIPPERWFAAGEGLVVVRALAAHVTEFLNDFKQPNPILRDLKAIDAVLVAAERAGVRFHLTRADV